MNFAVTTLAESRTPDRLRERREAARPRAAQDLAKRDDGRADERKRDASNGMS